MTSNKAHPDSLFNCRHRSLVALALVVILGSGCSSPHNTEPISQMEKQIGVELSEDTTLRVPEIRVIGQRIERHGDHEFHVADLVLVNPLAVPITYHGYRLDSWQTPPPAGEISPLYSMQIRDAENPDWHKRLTGWCGTGAGMMTVPPKHAARFDATFELPLLSAKIGLVCKWETADGASREIERWSEDLLDRPDDDPDA